MKRIISIIITLVLLTIASITAAEEVPTISFDAENYTVFLGKTVNIKTVITPRKSMKLEWASSNDEVATVGTNGRVKGVSVGEAVITARSIDNPDVSASCKVNVIIPVKRIKFTDKNVTLANGFVWRLRTVVEPEDATNKGLIWTSSDESIATVNEEGVVTGKKKGNVTITVKAVDGSNAKASIKVSINDYDIVITSPVNQKAFYHYVSRFPISRLSPKGKAKNNRVYFSNLDKEFYWSVYDVTESFDMNPLSAGADVVSLSDGKSKVNYNVYVHPDSFRMQDLGFGKGALITPGEVGVFSNHTYQVFKEKCTWEEAKEKCEQAGGHLVTITSAQEQQFLKLLNYDHSSHWIGLRKDEAGSWKWVNGEECNYTFWAEGQPDDYATREYQYENVVVMNPEWNDLHEENIESIIGYICEWDSITVDVEDQEKENTYISSDYAGVYKGHTYQVINEKCNWKTAKEICESKGGHLVTMNSADEGNFVWGLVNTKNTYWIGLYKDSDDSWKWVTDEELSIDSWDEGKPDNVFSREFPDENVAAMNPRWNDLHEDNIATISGFICEWDKIIVDPEKYSEQGIIGDVYNLAKFKEISTSSESVSHRITNAVDGDLKTYWQGDGFPAEVVVDLGRNSLVSSLSVRMDPDQDWEHFDIGFVTSISMDGKEFTVVHNGYMYEFREDSRNTISIEFDPAETRYVKLSFDDDYGLARNPVIGELSVFGAYLEN